MIYLDLITNLALLIALSVVSGFFDKRFLRNTWPGSVLQGVLFGTVAVIGMLHPLEMGPGLIFDGRTVILSLCALFFGPRATVMACGIAMVCRVWMGGAGLIMGLTTILSASLIGLWAHYRFKPSVQAPSILILYAMGLAVHVTMVALIFTLPGELALSTFKRLGLPVLLLYPLATILAGKVLSDHLSTLQAHEALRESEERYSLLFDTTVDAVLLSSPDGGILDANPAACRLFGRTKEELILLGRSAIVDPEDARLIPALDQRAATGKFAGELTFLRKDGSKFKGETSSSVFLNREGQARTGMIIRDITERKAIEESVQKIQKMLNETQRISKVGGWEFDPASKRVSWTDQVYRIHGVDENYDPADPEKDIMLLYAPEDRSMIAGAFRRAVKEGRSYDLELQVVTPEGERKWVRTMGQAQCQDGHVTRVFGNVIDITELKEKEQELKRIEWLLMGKPLPDSDKHQKYTPPYDDLVSLNTCRFILDHAGEPVLRDIVGDFLDLLDTSAAVYEKNGDYAMGIFSSAWCRLMDASSYALCNTQDNREALACGRWHCHESCWTNASKAAIETGQLTDTECYGGIRIYAVPIRAHGEVIGAINFGYGDPPRDETTLTALAAKYNVRIDDLRVQAAIYETRPPYIIELAKRRLNSSARLIGEIIERKQAEDELREKEVQYRNLADSGLALIWRAGTDKLCTYFNEPWLKFTGRTLAQEWGNGWTEGVHPEDLDRCVGIFVTAFDKREAFDMEYRLKHASGEYRWIRDLGTPNYTSSGEFIGYIGHCFDITGQKQADEEIRKLNNELEKKVQERTAELKQTIAELEDLNRVFVGRELKMAELKTRLAQLEGK